MELRDNNIPKGLIPLEKILIEREKGVREPIDKIEINIGSVESPKIIWIGNNCLIEEIKDIENIIKEYMDIVSWSYDDLKEYDKNII